MGSMAALSGVLARPVPGKDGVLHPQTIQKAIRPPKGYLARTTLLCLENTHNLAGGTVATVPEMEAAAKAAWAGGLKVHLDGARIFNAATALSVPASELARWSDTTMFCLSKGLGAPVGSVLVGDKETISKARRIRKRFGGGMRQGGILAAAGLVALNEMVPRLGEDHEKARKLAATLDRSPHFNCDVSKVQTNIVMAFPREGLNPQKVSDALAAKGVLAHAMGDRLRFVTHYQVDDEGLAYAMDAVMDPRLI